MTDRRTQVQLVLDRINEHGGDLNAAFPSPFRFHKHQRGRKQAFHDWELAHLLTERDPEKPWGWEAKGAFFVRPNPKNIDGFINGRLNITTRRSATGQVRPPEYVPPVSSIGDV